MTEQQNIIYDDPSPLVNCFISKGNSNVAQNSQMPQQGMQQMTTEYKWPIACNESLPGGSNVNTVKTNQLHGNMMHQHPVQNPLPQFSPPDTHQQPINHSQPKDKSFTVLQSVNLSSKNQKLQEEIAQLKLKVDSLTEENKSLHEKLASQNNIQSKGKQLLLIFLCVSLIRW